MTKRRCKACGEEFPATPEFFATIIVKAKNWSGFASECRPCRNLRFKPYYEKNRDDLIAKATARTNAYRATPEGAEKAREWSREQKRRELSDPVRREEHVARAREWRAANPDKVKLFKHEQKPFKAQRVMRRYAKKKRGTVAWADQRKIEIIYAIADFLSKRTGVKYQVDHYYPLMGKTMSGLHVPENLRVITAAANQAKGNREPLAGDDEWMSTEKSRSHSGMTSRSR